ncbi:MAG: hypothetical protein NTZ39_09900 [Methanoregula sp.]|nr:hypothetical protein [Methanoregula sp.]
MKRGIIRDGFEVYAEEILLGRNPASPVCRKGKTKTAMRKKK